MRRRSAPRAMKMRCILKIITGAVIVLYFLSWSNFLRKESNAGTEIAKLNLKYVVVHLDVKGMPPTMDYLISFLSMIKKRGANAVLMEYEDMFPYSGRLVNLSHSHCYKTAEVKRFLTAAHKMDIEVIPLVQTFGHMEFVLKLPQFRHLREIPKYPDSICPSQNESLVLIHDMLEQIISFHNTIHPLKHIHVGCDEVYSLRKCAVCKARNQSRTSIMLEHVIKVVNIVKKLSPNTKTLIWDDMFRHVKPLGWEIQKEKSHLKNVDTVIWAYNDVLTGFSHINLRQYHLLYDNIWIASAFKGADGHTATFPNINMRFANHYRWLSALVDYRFAGEKRVSNFKGIILTGWSRYNHFEPLCELLPVSLPSLFINLNVIKRFKDGINFTLEEDWFEMFSEHFYDPIAKDLQCLFSTQNYDFSVCQFDNVELYKVMRRFKNLKEHIFRNLFLEEDTNIYTLKYYFQKDNSSKRYLGNPLLFQNMNSELIKVKQDMYNNLAKVYDKAFIDEYIESKTFAIHQTLDEILNILKIINY